MLSLIGLISLLLSLVLGLCVIFSYYFKKNIFFISVYLKFISILISFSSLILAYIFSDFSNYNVFQNSHSTKPLLYKITGAWGNHEGSMILWLLIISFYGVIFSFNKTLNKNLKELTIFFQSVIYLFFCLFVVLTSNPFLLNKFNPKEGLGLNPILQDPALAIHPPVLYLGYVGFSIILSLALSGTILNKINRQWVITTKNWALFCWSMLAGGIALGSYWAYYELGWGGWWFWDPVENVSLMPWIAGLALVHSLMITQEEQLLKRWVVFLSILCFSLSIFGTFLVRSGILTSVHSFATDSARGIFILTLFLVITGFSFIVFIFQRDDNNNKLNLLFINKQTSLVINNIVMIIACITILLGTIYPIIIEVITDKRISVGAPYYNSTALPILLPGFLLMSVAPVLSWQSNRLPKYKIYFISFILLSFLSLIIVYLTNFNIWAFVGISLSFIIIAGSLISMYFNIIKFNLNNFFYYNNALIAHIGVGITILGITCSSIYQSENNEAFMVNETKIIGSYSLTLKNVKTIEKNNFQELMAKFVVSNNGSLSKEMYPSKRYYYVSKVITTEASIFHDWFRDFYIILGDQKNEKWNVKIYQNPLVSFIWLGVILMIFSGLKGIRK